MKRYECRLFPFEREDIVSIQEAKQRVGWNITAFDLPHAWKHAEGENVKIAVLDTGCDLNHPDLKNNLLLVRKLIGKIAPSAKKFLTNLIYLKILIFVNVHFILISRQSCVWNLYLIRDMKSLKLPKTLILIH